MHVDVMRTPKPWQQMGTSARHIASAGFDGILFTEAGRSWPTAYTCTRSASLFGEVARQIRHLTE